MTLGEKEKGMGSSEKVTARIATRVEELVADFDSYVTVFTQSGRFTGPCWYFHEKTIQARNDAPSIEALFADHTFFEYLYATLTSWGLHRMGPGNAKLRDIEEIKESFNLQLQAISDLSKLSLLTLPRENIRKTAEKVWRVLTSLRVSIAEAQIVANSKALHHVIPCLLPPIDREYTFNFFYDRKSLSIPEERAFIEMFTAMAEIARRNAEAIHRFQGSPWNTSESKVIDNAVVGFMIHKATPNTPLEPPR